MLKPASLKYIVASIVPTSAFNALCSSVWSLSRFLSVVAISVETHLWLFFTADCATSSQVLGAKLSL